MAMIMMKVMMIMVLSSVGDDDIYNDNVEGDDDRDDDYDF